MSDPPTIPRAVLDAIETLVAYLEDLHQAVCIVRRNGSWSIQTTEVPESRQGRHPKGYLPQTCAVHPGIVLWLWGDGRLECPQCKQYRIQHP